ncbi:MAG: hypothetical protein WAM60_15760 [Candidatus Promineifilaceae bacterium]
MISARGIKLTLLAWLAMIGFDLFLHGGLLSCLYQQDSPFLLSPDRAFTLIPVGYVSFLLLAVLLVWLMRRLGLKGWKSGTIFGLQIGMLIWGSLILGLLSISTASLTLLFGWFVGQTLELGLAGTVVGIGFTQERLRRLTLQVTGLIIVSIIVTIILQNTVFVSCP